MFLYTKCEQMCKLFTHFSLNLQKSIDIEVKTLYYKNNIFYFGGN